ncbi:hypothetical protein [Acidianus sp. RZ1]|uniref:hypothetical protein n=1 Tax=Acidianus sp. RZ1 TaxID=1540082 RepID=UPI0035302602
MLLVPFIPSPYEVAEEMLRCVKAGEDDIVVDLGSGDGRLISLAKEKFHVSEAIGVEIERKLCHESKNDKVEVICGDIIYIADFLLRRATVVTVYLSSRANEIVERMILDSGNKRLKIVSHDFEFKKLKLINTRIVKAKGLLGTTSHTIFCYTI